MTAQGPDTTDPVIAARMAAEARVGAFLEDLGRLDAEALMQTALAESTETPAREAARHEAAHVAREAGLETTLETARSTVRETMLHVYDTANYRPTMVGLNWGLSEGTTADRVATIRAAEDAVMAVVVEPYASEALIAELSSAFELVDRGRAVPASVDMTEATARAIRPAASTGPTGWLVVVVAAVVIAVAFLSGSWAVGVVLVLLAGLLTLLRRRRGSDAIRPD
ncbi:MAG TPA: hypothetical protein VD763_03105 [Candidatus Saccharimonadales bacterium]|nr:hypothetical protein [Candidatus Saccharimonadales bacterium]